MKRPWIAPQIRKIAFRPVRLTLFERVQLLRSVEDAVRQKEPDYFD